MTCRCGPTVVGDVGDLEAPRAVGLVGLEADPEPAGAGGEGDGPLVRLARLVGGDGRGRPCGGGGEYNVVRLDELLTARQARRLVSLLAVVHF